MTRYWTYLLSMLCVATTLACEGGSECSNGSTRFRALAYSKSFATRFQLSPASAIELYPGIQAMAIRVKEDPSVNVMCSIDLYMDDSILFAYPPGSAGRQADVDPEFGPLFFVHKLSDADGKASLSHMLGPNMAYRSHGYSEQHKGVVQGGGVSAFYRSLLPGLNVIEFNVTCNALDLSNAPADVWLLRAGHDSTEFVAAEPREDVAYRIPVPIALLEAAAEATGKAAKRPVNLVPYQPHKYSVAKAPAK